MKTLIFLVSDLNQEWADHESHQKQTEVRTKPTDGNNNVIDKNIQVEPKNLIVNSRQAISRRKPASVPLRNKR